MSITTTIFRLLGRTRDVRSQLETEQPLVHYMNTERTSVENPIEKIEINKEERNQIIAMAHQKSVVSSLIRIVRKSDIPDEIVIPRKQTRSEMVAHPMPNYIQATREAIRHEAIIPIHRQVINITITYAQSEIYLQEAIFNNLAEIIAYDMDHEVLHGSGLGRPSGILADKNIINYELNHDDPNHGGYIVAKWHRFNRDTEPLKAAAFRLPRRYRTNATWMMHSDTFKFVSKLVDRADIGVSAIDYHDDDNSPYIFWHKVVINDNMPLPINGEFAIILGDFSGYTWIDSNKIRFDKHTFKDRDDGFIQAHVSMGGQVLDPSAFYLIKIVKPTRREWLNDFWTYCLWNFKHFRRTISKSVKQLFWKGYAWTHQQKNQS